MARQRGGKRRIDPVGLVALADQGLGCSLIAPIFDVTPSAVINAAHRWGILLKGSPGPRPYFPDREDEAAERAARRERRRASPGPTPPKVDPEELARLIADGLRIAQLERALHVHRATLHRVARRAGLALPKPHHLSREDWVVLIVEHGLDVPALALATGRMRCVVRRALLGHGLLQTWWGRRGKRYAEWTIGEED